MILSWQNFQFDKLGSQSCCLASLGFLKESEFLSWKMTLQRNNVERNNICHHVFSVIYRASNYLSFFALMYALRFWGIYRIANYGSCWPQLLQKHWTIGTSWNVIYCCFNILYWLEFAFHSPTDLTNVPRNLLSLKRISKCKQICNVLGVLSWKEPQMHFCNTDESG